MMLDDEFIFENDRLKFYVTIDMPLNDWHVEEIENEIRAFLKLSKNDRCPIEVCHDYYGSFVFLSSYFSKTVYAEDLKAFLNWFEHLSEDVTNSSTIEAIYSVISWQENGYGFQKDSKVSDLIDYICNYPNLLKMAHYSFDKKDNGEEMFEMFKNETGRKPTETEKVEIQGAILTAVF